MQYDIRLLIEYAYSPPVAGGRHLIRLAPVSVAPLQRVIASAIVFDPVPVERTEGRDFFGNAVVAVAYAQQHARLKIQMNAHVEVATAAIARDVSPGIAMLRGDLDGVLSLAPDSPHHFCVGSPRVALDDDITAYARESVRGAPTLREMVRRLGERIHSDFRYDSESTEVETPPKQAFELRRGVCQDFSQIMIAGLRGVGIPAGYVSGFLRTTPPPGKPRLTGADAMHAWVRAWCGSATGWVGYDPTNRTFAGPDHIIVATGRDYGDVAPVAGILRTSGRQRTSQAVDVVPL
jgi:transglutaminase-like putative cysteine protease